jgi:hypothetical protein
MGHADRSAKDSATQDAGALHDARDDLAATPPVATRCARCAAPFHCGAAAGSVECWCVAEPHAAIDPQLRGCLCPACLAQAARATAPR